ncbi:MAG: FAD-binding oxidoreductase [Elainellaceae cyanobacterium]
MAHLYHPAVYDRSVPVGSYWETTVEPPQCPRLERSHTCDVAIIGAGLTGLSAALHLSQQGVDVAVVDAGYPGWGASGRNGGFCCEGASNRSGESLVQQFGIEETRQFYQEQRQAIALVKTLAESEAIDIQPQGSGELLVTHKASRQGELAALAEFLRQVALYPCKLLNRDQLAAYGFRNAEATAGLWIDAGFGLNPLKYSVGLAQALMRRGVMLYSHSLVQRWESTGGCHHLHTPGGTLRAKRVLVATNGYTGDRLHPAFSGGLLPILSSIITTRPLTLSERQAQGWTTETPVYDSRNLLFYYRILADGRCLFGARGGTWGSPADGDRRYRAMEQQFRAIFPAWSGVEMTHAWSGLVCMSANLTPQLGQLPEDESVFYALAYHGNGVATATWSGKTVAQWMTGEREPSTVSAIFRQPLRSFPLPHARIWGLRAVSLGYRLLDALP